MGDFLVVSEFRTGAKLDTKARLVVVRDLPWRFEEAIGDVVMAFS
jgi:hypothetical protein